MRLTFFSTFSLPKWARTDNGLFFLQESIQLILVFKYYFVNESRHCIMVFTKHNQNPSDNAPLNANYNSFCGMFMGFDSVETSFRFLTSPLPTDAKSTTSKRLQEKQILCLSLSFSCKLSWLSKLAIAIKLHKTSPTLLKPISRVLLQH